MIAGKSTPLDNSTALDKWLTCVMITTGGTCRILSGIGRRGYADGTATEAAFSSNSILSSSLSSSSMNDMCGWCVD
jgi:hypothetical protein